jgi:hypothetical protein
MRKARCRKKLFFEKKGGVRSAGTKKLLVLWRALPKQHATASKSFLLLFFKKEVLAFFPGGASGPPPHLSSGL